MSRNETTLRKTAWTAFVATVALGSALHGQPQALATDAPDVAAAEDQDAQPSAQDRLFDKLSQSIAKQYPGAKVSIDPQIHWTHGTLSESFQGVSLLGETSRGEMMFSITTADGRRGGEGWAGFSAWIPARVAVKRIHPGEKLTADMFAHQDVNVAQGQAHELRGVIFESENQLANLQARQSVLEGQMLLSTAVERIPDVRRGDTVSVQLISNGLTLLTQGVAEEPGYTGSQLRVTASKTKRELVGKLNPSGTVEVKL